MNIHTVIVHVLVVITHIFLIDRQPLNSLGVMPSIKLLERSLQKRINNILYISCTNFRLILPWLHVIYHMFQYGKSTCTRYFGSGIKVQFSSISCHARLFYVTGYKYNPSTNIKGQTRLFQLQFVNLI